jgi:hypothetical protein
LLAICHDRREHGQLAAPTGDDASLDDDVVTEIDQRLPVVQRLLPHLGETQHDLEPGPGPLLEGGEAQLSGVADEDDAAGDPDDVRGFLAGLEVPPLLADLLEGVRPPHLDRVGVPSAVEQPLPLVATNPDLFRDVGVGRFGRLAGHRSSMSEPA